MGLTAASQVLNAGIKIKALILEGKYSRIRAVLCRGACQSLPWASPAPETPVWWRANWREDPELGLLRMPGRSSTHAGGRSSPGEAAKGRPRAAEKHGGIPAALPKPGMLAAGWTGSAAQPVPKDGVLWPLGCRCTGRLFLSHRALRVPCAMATGAWWLVAGGQAGWAKF